MKIKSTIDFQLDNLNVLIFAPSGHGKTSLAKTLPGKTIIVSLESGLLALKGFDVDYVEVEGKNGVEKFKALKQIINEVALSDYDNISSFQPIP